jgi:hypothetical protein
VLEIGSFPYYEKGSTKVKSAITACYTTRPLPARRYLSRVRIFSPGADAEGRSTCIYRGQQYKNSLAERENGGEEEPSRQAGLAILPAATAHRAADQDPPVCSTSPLRPIQPAELAGADSINQVRRSRGHLDPAEHTGPPRPLTRRRVQF